MLRVVSSDDQILAVASIDGLDPLNPRPASLPAGEFLTVAIYNPTTTARNVKLLVRPPHATTLEPVRQQLIRTTAKGPTETSNSTPALESTIALERGSLLVLTYKVLGKSSAPTVFQRQFFAPVTFQQVTPMSFVDTIVAVDQTALKSARRAWVRYVADHLADDEAELEINGKTIPLPGAATADNSPALRQVVVEPSLLKPENRIAIRVKPHRAGFHLACLSLDVETDTPTPALSSSDRLPAVGSK
jgi:hypothetical protein